MDIFEVFIGCLKFNEVYGHYGEKLIHSVSHV